jgi:RHS repeat-associated protein
MLVSSTGTPQGPFGYAGGWGYQEDADSGLKLLGHRYYDASTGRFLTRDPAKDGRNWYGYCENNPANSVDTAGTNPFLLAAIVIVFILTIEATHEGGESPLKSHAISVWLGGWKARQIGKQIVGMVVQPWKRAWDWTKRLLLR